MALKDILVHVDGGIHSATRVDVALSLAAAHQAHCIGLYVRPPLNIPEFLKLQYGAEIFEVQDRYAAESEGKAEQVFLERARATGISHEWRLAQGNLAEMVGLHSRYTDLCVAGQVDPRDSVAGEDPRLVDQLVLEAGRPVLAVPYAGRFATVGERVLVAWNASREATRAVREALPLLIAARSVTVLVVNAHVSPRVHGDMPGSDICHHLARHGVKAEAQSVSAEDVDIGAMILSRAADLGADMLVMGAYGRSRLRELILGGATRHILQHMTLPVLMAH